jgi:hypothetical protein
MAISVSGIAPVAPLPLILGHQGRPLDLYPPGTYPPGYSRGRSHDTGHLGPLYAMVVPGRAVSHLTGVRQDLTPVHSGARVHRGVRQPHGEA